MLIAQGQPVESP
jgi:hypothetical protein